MLIAVVICLGALALLIWMLRASQVSLGLPIAYLSSLLLIHVPGAIAYLLDSDGILRWRIFTEAGIAFTAIGAVCFVSGVGLNHIRAQPPIPIATNRAMFNRFCLLGGWMT